MESLDEIAKEYAQKVAGVVAPETLITYTIEELNEFSKIDFKAGFEYAQHWIPVEEELPTFGNDILIKFKDHPIKKYAVWLINTQIDIDLIKKIASHWRPVHFL